MSPIVPFVALLAGWGVWRVSARALRRPAWAGAAVVVLCAAVNMPALVRAGDYALRGWPQVIAFFDKKAVAGDRVFVSDNIEANVLAHYVPKLVVDRGYDWPAAVQDATGRMRRGEYRFVMLLVRPGRPQKARWSWQKSWPAATELPYYDAVKAKYPLVQSVKCDADEVVVELRERQGP
jgi:hypothetical protein